MNEIFNVIANIAIDSLELRVPPLHTLPEDGSRCPVCQATTDGFGDQVSCGGNRDWILCHDSLRKVLFIASHSAAQASPEESTMYWHWYLDQPPALIHVPGASSFPVDVYLFFWKRGRPATLDMTAISPLQKLTIDDAASTQGHVLGTEDEK